MTRLSVVRVAMRALPLLLLAPLLFAPHVLAEGPMLIVHLNGGEAAVYPVGEITRIGFEDPRAAARMFDAIRLFLNRPNPVRTGTLISFVLSSAGTA